MPYVIATPAVGTRPGYRHYLTTPSTTNQKGLCSLSDRRSDACIFAYQKNAALAAANIKTAGCREGCDCLNNGTLAKLELVSEESLQKEVKRRIW